MATHPVSSRRSDSIDRVRLFEIDPDLLARTPKHLHDELRREITVPVLPLPRGEWDPSLPANQNLACFLVLHGLLSRRTEIYGQRVVELIGPGDPLRPIEATDWATPDYQPSWNVESLAQVAVLDSEFEGETARMPGVLGQLLGREEHRARIFGIRAGIARIRPLRAALLAMLWHLGDLWGRREQGRVVLELDLPGRVLAGLLGARRPSVSTALTELRSLGLVDRKGDPVTHPLPQVARVRRG